MARDFDGNTDRIDYANIWNPSGQAQSLSFWIYPETLADSQYLFLTHPIGDGSFIGGGNFWCFEQEAEYILQFTAYTDDTHINRSGENILTVNTLQHIILTWDGSLTGVNIHIYKNGSEITYLTTTDGIGNFIAGTGSHSIGGRINDDLRNFNARFAEFGWWNRIISAGEIAALAKGYSPRFFPNGLKFAPDLIRHQRDPISGKVGTLDGTTVSVHSIPGLKYPSKIWIPHIAVEAPPAGVMAAHYYKRLLAGAA